jgi:hypothetical protein
LSLLFEDDPKINFIHPVVENPAKYRHLINIFVGINKIINSLTKHIILRTSLRTCKTADRKVSLTRAWAYKELIGAQQKSRHINYILPNSIGQFLSKD